MAMMEEVTQGITTAMKSRDQGTLGPLRMLKSALTMKEIEKGRPLEPLEEQQVVSSLVKQRRDSIDQFTRGNRPELADREAAEIKNSSSGSSRRRWARATSTRPLTPPLHQRAQHLRRTSAR